MARSTNRLSARTVATASNPGLLADGGGLYLQISPSGAKSWVFRFSRNGRTRDMGLGPLHTVPLSEARNLAAGCRSLVREGVDPIERRKALRLAALAESEKAVSFQQCAEAFIEAHRAGWKNAKHGEQWRSTLSQYAYPAFGKLPVSAVDTGLVLKALEPIWQTKTETASRLRGRIEAVLDWARVRNFRDGENPARWRGHLDKLLAKPSKVQKTSHHAALPYDEIGAFMADLKAQSHVSAKALAFVILTAARTGEVLGATWDEIDLEKAVWTIPASRMKAGREHRIPLSKDALAILRGLPRIEGNPHLFPGLKPKRPLSNMAMLKSLERMGRRDLTAHGFRSSFRDWAGEQTAFPREVCEHALAHRLKDKAEAAYQRGDLFDKRRALMDAWAGFCALDTAKHGNVRPIRAKAGRPS